MFNYVIVGIFMRRYSNSSNLEVIEKLHILIKFEEENDCIDQPFKRHISLLFLLK